MTSRRRRLRAGTVVIVLLTLSIPLSACASSTPSERPVGFADSQSDTSSEASARPKTTTAQVTADEPIDFARTNAESAAYPSGTSQITVTGAPGVRSVVYRVTYIDGVETSRAEVSSTVTVAPVDEVTTLGTFVAPPPPAVAAAPSGCDSNYAGQCVPIASDVDCAGGSGNGPAYTSGPVTIVGSDIYDLDNDGDGIACDR